jgi:hypothetical protein
MGSLSVWQGLIIAVTVMLLLNHFFPVGGPRRM